MKVSELAQRTKVSVHRLRRYEAMGLIIAQRDTSGYREFTDRTVREVIFIAMSRDLGLLAQGRWRHIARLPCGHPHIRPDGGADANPHCRG